jgi:hypothetical protein
VPACGLYCCKHIAAFHISPRLCTATTSKSVSEAGTSGGRLDRHSGLANQGLAADASVG